MNRKAPRNGDIFADGAHPAGLAVVSRRIPERIDRGIRSAHKGSLAQVRVDVRIKSIAYTT